jgi:cation diffusion facilitator family transporter
MPPHLDISSAGEPSNEKKRIALTSVFAAVFITVLKLVVGLETNSLGLLSEAAHSGLDFLAALMTYIAVHIADRPADKEHQYGHGKIENLSAFLETILLVITCSWIIWEAVHRLSGGAPHVETSVWSFVVIGIAIIVDISRSRALKRVAIKYRSQALEADALHFSSDVWSSLVVLLGLVCVSLGYVWVDAVAAMIVAILVLFVSYRLGRRTIDALMDRVPDGLYEQVVDLVRGVQGVEDVRSIRIRPSGAKVFVDTTIAIRRTTPFQQAHAIMDSVEKAITEQHAEFDVVVHAEPAKTTDESIADKIRMVVVGHGLRPPHNLEVQRQEGSFHVEFDIEYAPGKSFVEAHAIADDIEAEILRDIPAVRDVTVHMEEMRVTPHEITADAADEQLREQIRAIVVSQSSVVSCGDVRILCGEGQCAVNLTCTFQRSLPLEEVHRQVSQIETQLYERFPEVRKVTVHAEPASQ